MHRIAAITALLLWLPLLGSCREPARASQLEITRLTGSPAGFEFDLVVSDAEGAGLSVAGTLEIELKYRDRVSRGARALCHQTLSVSAQDYGGPGQLTQSGTWQETCEPTDEADVWLGLSFEPMGDAGHELSARADAPAALLVRPATPPPAPVRSRAGQDGQLEIPALGIRVIVPEGSRTAQSPGDLEESVAISTPIDDCRPAILPLPEGLGLDYAAAKEGCLGCEYQVDERDGERGWRLRFTMPGVPGWAITRGFELGGRMLSCRASAQTENGALCALAICDSVRAL